MPSATDRIEFAPPRSAGAVRAFGLALIIHVLLIAALTWGVNWKQQDQSSAVEAELWTRVPQQAAPRLMPQPDPAPAVKPPPVIKDATPAPDDPDIALEQEKKRKLQQEKLRAELQARLEREKARQAEVERERKERQAKEELAKRKAAEEAREAKLAEAQKLETRQLQQQKQAEATAAEKRRQEQLQRMMGMAGASGGPEATGRAQRSGGPSAGYGGKVRAKVLPNVVFTDDIVGNPTAEVEVRTTADGAILGQRLVKSSGNKAWDDAVIKAIIRTASLPKDVDGRVPTPMILEFRPRD